MTQPTIDTARLRLRPFQLSDAPDVQRLAGEWEIADTTLRIPHPYEDGMAEEWIATHAPEFAAGAGAAFAIQRNDDSSLVGAIGLTVDKSANEAELGYWVGKPYWNQGYATEATRSILAYGFRELGLDRIHAAHLVRNPASGRVMAKAGMVLEEASHRGVWKGDQYEELVAYGIRREEWRSD